MKEEICNKLNEWGSIITTRYPGLRIRYEFSETRRVFLVSFYTDDVRDIDTFSVDAMAFEDEMEDMYGNESPLFCDNESLFRLSPEAQMILGIPENHDTALWEFTCDDIFTYSELNSAA